MKRLRIKEIISYRIRTVKFWNKMYLPNARLLWPCWEWKLVTAKEWQNGKFRSFIFTLEASQNNLDIRNKSRDIINHKFAPTKWQEKRSSQSLLIIYFENCKNVLIIPLPPDLNVSASSPGTEYPYRKFVLFYSVCDQLEITPKTSRYTVYEWFYKLCTKSRSMNIYMYICVCVCRC